MNASLSWMFQTPAAIFDPFTRGSSELVLNEKANNLYSLGLNQTISIAVKLQSLPRCNPRKERPKVRCHYRHSKSKRQDGEWTHSDAKSQTRNCNLIRCPKEPMNGLVAHFVTFLEYMHVKSCVYGLVPPRLGYNEAVDCAARAVAHAYQRGPFNQVTSNCQFPTDYIKAVTCLRNSLDASDNSLMVIMLLIMFERLVSDEPTNTMAHLKGLTALLCARSNTKNISDVESKLIGNKSVSHFIPLMTKTSSPFEDSRWLEFHAVACSPNLPAPIRRLEQLGFQLQVRLPRLVNYVRSLKECEGHASANETLALTAELVSLKDSEAENEILHRIHVESTKDVADKAIVPCSLKFNSREEYDAIKEYWHGRVMLGRLCFILSLLPEVNDSVFAFDLSTSTAESHRMIANLFMSIQYTESCGMIVRARHAATLQVCLQTLLCFSEFRGLPIDRVRTWLAEKISAVERTGSLTAFMLEMTEIGLRNCP